MNERSRRVKVKDFQVNEPQADGMPNQHKSLSYYFIVTLKLRCRYHNTCNRRINSSLWAEL